jgi:hypothetical protein
MFDANDFNRQNFREDIINNALIADSDSVTLFRANEFSSFEWKGI